MICRIRVLLKLALRFLNPFILLALEFSTFPLIAIITTRNYLLPTLFKYFTLELVLMSTFLYFREHLKSIDLISFFILLHRFDNIYGLTRLHNFFAIISFKELNFFTEY